MILAIGTTHNTGGLGIVFYRLYNKLLKSGLPHHWILFGEDVPNFDLINKGNITFFQLKSNWKFYESEEFIDKSISCAVQKLFLSLRVKVVLRPLEYIYEPYLSFIDIPQVYCAHLLTRPLLDLVNHNWYRNQPKVKKGIYADNIRKLWEDQAIKSSCHIICNSKTTLNGLKRFYNIEGKKISTESLGASISEDAKFYKNNYFSNKCLFFGRITYQKGVPNLLNVKGDNSLHIIGRGKWSPSEITERGIQYHNWINHKDVDSIINSHTYILFPSFYEPWGLSLNESLLHGKICIAQKGAGGHEEQISNGFNGFLVDFNKSSYIDIIKKISSMEHYELSKVSENAKKNAHKSDLYNNIVIETIKSYL